MNEKGYILFFPAKRFRTFLQICNQTYFCKYASRQTNASQPCPQSFSHFLRDEMEPLHPFTQTQQKGMFLCIPGPSCGRVQIIYKISVNLDTKNKSGLSIYFIQMYQKRKYGRNHAWIIWAWKRRKFTRHLFSAFASLYFSENGKYLTFTHFAWYEQRLAAQITHWTTKTICDNPATPDSPVLKESSI